MELPDDMIYEILSRLPAKSICKLKCCSKAISGLAEESYFAMKQSQNSMLKDDSCFFIQKGIEQYFSCRAEVHALLGEEISSSCVPSNFLSFLHESTSHILASSNGLILCRILRTKTPSQLLISNPATQSWSFIPTPESMKEHPNASRVFAFEFNGNDYKLICLETESNGSSSIGCEIYVPKEGVWKTRERILIGGKNFIRNELLPLFYKGAIHFLIDCFSRDTKNDYSFIAAYTHESGILRFLRLPKEASDHARNYHSNLNIFKWGKSGSSSESICLVRLIENSSFILWVLTDYESNSWSKILTISLNELGLSNKKESAVIGFTIMNGNSLVFAMRGKVYTYDLMDVRKNKLEEICEHELRYSVHFFPYSSTLRSCGPNAVTLPLLT